MPGLSGEIVDVNYETPRPTAVDLPVEVARGEQVRSSRGRLGPLFRFAAGAAVFLGLTVGKDFKGAFVDRHNDKQHAQAKAEIAKIEKNPHHSHSLEAAQGRLARQIFDEGRVGSQINAVTKATGNITPVRASDYVDPADTAENGVSLTIGGKTYALGKREIKEGSAAGFYVIAGELYVEEQWLRPNISHMAAPLIVGGARAKDGKTAEVLSAEADVSAKKNLAIALQNSKKPVQIRVINGGGHVGEREFFAPSESEAVLLVR